MTKNESPPQQRFSSSERTDDSERFDAILALGRKLVDELGLEQSVDTLGRWMAHHVASLITRCEAEDGEDKESAKKECFDAILTLWTHRRELPNGKRPFEDLDPIVRAVASLDPEDDTPRYFQQARPPKGKDEGESKAEFWLKLVDGLDYSAKLLIGYCLAQAANSAIDKSQEWVQHAIAAGLDYDPSEIVIRLVAPNDELSKEPDQNAKFREQLEGRLTRLEGFLKLASALTDDMKTQLKDIPLSTAEVVEATNE